MIGKSQNRRKTEFFGYLLSCLSQGKPMLNLFGRWLVVDW